MTPTKSPKSPRTSLRVRRAKCARPARRDAVLPRSRHRAVAELGHRRQTDRRPDRPGAADGAAADDPPGHRDAVSLVGLREPRGSATHELPTLPADIAEQITAALLPRWDIVQSHRRTSTITAATVRAIIRTDNSTARRSPILDAWVPALMLYLCRRTHKCYEAVPTCCRRQTTFSELSLIRAAAPMTASRWPSRTSPRTGLSSMPFARPARRSLLMQWSMTSRRC